MWLSWIFNQNRIFLFAADYQALSFGNTWSPSFPSTCHSVCVCVCVRGGGPCILPVIGLGVWCSQPAVSVNSLLVHCSCSQAPFSSAAHYLSCFFSGPPPPWTASSKGGGGVILSISEVAEVRPSQSYRRCFFKVLITLNQSPFRCGVEHMLPICIPVYGSAAWINKRGGG